MQVTPDTPAPMKKSRAKVKAETVAAEPKKPRSRKKAIAAPIPTPQPDTPPTVEELNGMIATAAYYIAAQRDFSPGQELDDWLAAERAVRSRYAL